MNTQHGGRQTDASSTDPSSTYDAHTYYYDLSPRSSAHSLLSVVSDESLMTAATPAPLSTSNLSYASTVFDSVPLPAHVGVGQSSLLHVGAAGRTVPQLSSPSQTMTTRMATSSARMMAGGGVPAPAMSRGRRGGGGGGGGGREGGGGGGGWSWEGGEGGPEERALTPTSSLLAASEWLLHGGGGEGASSSSTASRARRQWMMELDRRRVEEVLGPFQGPCLLDCIVVELSDVDVFSARRTVCQGEGEQRNDGENFKIVREVRRKFLK